MNLLHNAKVRTKLFILTGTFITALIIVGLTGYYYLSQSNNRIVDMYNGRLLAIENLEKGLSIYNITNSHLFEMMITTDENRYKELAQAMETEKNQVVKYIDTYTNTKPTSTFEVNTIKQLQANFPLVSKPLEDVVSLSLANKKAEAYEVYKKDLNVLNQNVADNISDLISYNVQEAEKLSVQNSVAFIRARYIILGITVLTLLLGAFLGQFIMTLIVKPIKFFERYVGQVASGDLSEETLEKAKDVELYNDEIGNLGRSLIEMRQKLWELVTKVSDSVEQIASSSEELSSSADQQAQATSQVATSISDVAIGTEKQSNAVDETIKAMDQIFRAIEHVATSSSAVADQATKTSFAAKEGQKTVDMAVGQMDKIGRSTSEVQESIVQLANGSKKIGDITEVISDIADQTNLLALNAAIESARAGEQGRGFAVVAEEVRKLAEQSSEAAKQISDLINENQTNIDKAVRDMLTEAQDVETGIEVVSTAGKTFEQIANSVNQVVSHVQEVSATAEEMASGSRQIVSSIKQIETISKENLDQSQLVSAATEEQTASIEEIASSSQSLANMAQELQVAISEFRV